MPDLEQVTFLLNVSVFSSVNWDDKYSPYRVIQRLNALTYKAQIVIPSTGLINVSYVIK